MSLFLSLFKIFLLYFTIVTAYYLMGKKNINEFSIMDFIFFLLLSNFITISMQAEESSFIYTSIIIVFMITLQVIMTYISSNISVIRYLYRSKPLTIIKKGKLDFKRLVKRNYDFNDLLLQLKEKGIKSIEDIECGILENDGSLSIKQYNNTELPLPIVVDGEIQEIILKLLHKDNSWINTIISKEKIKLNNIFYAFYKKGRLYIIKSE